MAAKVSTAALAALAALSIARLANVLHSPIPDCDEVFNYYEPLNFLVRGFGKRTWEYSPQFAIRSWAYLLPYTTVLPLSWIVDRRQWPPALVFYAVRLVTVLFTLYSEIHAYHTLSKFNRSLALWYLCLTTVSTGMSHASVALLPSSLAMNCTLLATSNFLTYSRTKSTRNALLVTSWLMLGGLFGWPFMLVLGLPTMSYIIWDKWNDKIRLSRYWQWSLTIGAIYFATSMEVDHWFYGKTVAVPLNIVLYNVINADESSGPNIFGTEPLTYYIYNLLLNFHIIAPLAYSSVLLTSIPLIFFKSQWNKAFLAGVATPLYLWSAIFFSQPHKEERFLYPVYGLINIAGAVSISQALTFLSSLEHLAFKRKVVKLLNKVIVIITSSLIIIFSLLRTVSYSQNYNTPLAVFAHIPTIASGNLCLGREWYRYPSSFFLPSTLRLRFVESGFNGLLPGDFEEIDFLKSIQSEPEGMNNLNLYDPGKVVPIGQCDYAIDISQEVGEKDHDFQTGPWELIWSAKFLNNEESSGIGKYLWLPQCLYDATHTKLTYHDYNLYRAVQV